MTHRRTSFAAVLHAALLIAVVAPAAASAVGTPRYASPSGTAMNPCDDPMNACPIETAINSAFAGADVTLLPGSYTTSTFLDPPDGVTVHGTVGARPVVNTSAVNGFDMTNGTLQDVVVEHSGGGGTAIFTNGGGALIERVRSHSFASAYSPCAIGPDDTIRDSVCWFTGGDTANDTAALKVFADFAGADTATVRNVTAVSYGTSAGLWAASLANGASITVNATNVIAFSGTGPDVRTFEFPSGGDGQTINLDHSNYDSELEAIPQGGPITNPGTGTANQNQTTPPVFVDPMDGDLRQAPGSAGTIDLGTATGLLPGELDFEGQARNQGLAPDIGGDELFVAPPAGGGPAPGTVTPTPTVPPKKKCKKKKRKKRAAAAKKCKKKKKR